MAYKWKTKWAKKISYDAEAGALALTRFKWIVIHYTANDGDSDEGNGNYFSETGSNKAYAGAHVFVDDDSATKSVPLKYAAYAVGGSLYLNYRETGGGQFYGKCTNYNSISIEMCDTMKDGVRNLSEETYRNTVDIVKYYMRKYDIDADHVIRHWDVTGKTCPEYFVGRDNAYWNQFKRDIVA